MWSAKGRALQPCGCKGMVAAAFFCVAYGAPTYVGTGNDFCRHRKTGGRRRILARPIDLLMSGFCKRCEWRWWVQALAMIAINPRLCEVV